MALLTAELKEQIVKVGTCHLVTASKFGVPNAAPMGAYMVMDNDMIWIANNFMNKTAANLKENPQVSILVWNKDLGNCFQLKGTAVVEKGTEDYKKLKAMLDAKKPGLPCKELVKITVKEIFTCMPGPNAGKKI
ncbi:MAG TPA: pyridoxamine 5'-phosphate oxidase family protein [Methanocorpusculum sp.]|nr:pyridoxamine 5'-phosphate oxidase family protein [Methanocorpusculum sp.]